MSRHGLNVLAASGITLTGSGRERRQTGGENPQGVRVATPRDIMSLHDIVPDILAENVILPLSMGRVEAVIAHCASQGAGAIAGIIDGQDGGIAATVGLVRIQDPLSDVAYFQAVWCGLSPEVRKETRALPKDDPRHHYGRRLFQFVRWFHNSMQNITGGPVLVRFDVLTKDGLGPKMNWYARNLTQIGGTFAIGVVGAFKQQAFPDAEIAA